MCEGVGGGVFVCVDAAAALVMTCGTLNCSARVGREERSDA